MRGDHYHSNCPGQRGTEKQAGPPVNTPQAVLATPELQPQAGPPPQQSLALQQVKPRPETPADRVYVMAAGGAGAVDNASLPDDYILRKQFSSAFALFLRGSQPVLPAQLADGTGGGPPQLGHPQPSPLSDREELRLCQARWPVRAPHWGVGKELKINLASAMESDTMRNIDGEYYLRGEFPDKAPSPMRRPPTARTMHNGRQQPRFTPNLGRAVTARRRGAGGPATAGASPTSGATSARPRMVGPVMPATSTLPTARERSAKAASPKTASSSARENVRGGGGVTFAGAKRSIDHAAHARTNGTGAWYGTQWYPTVERAMAAATKDGAVWRLGAPLTLGTDSESEGICVDVAGGVNGGNEGCE